MRKLLFLAMLAVFPAWPQASRFLGAWRLVSVEGHPAGLPDFYDHPSGMLLYVPTGQMSAQIAAKANRKPFAPFNQGRRSATTEEKAAAFDSYLAYYGTFTVDEKAGTVTHHIEDYSVPGRRGTDNVRWFEFRDPNHLVLIPVEDGKGGRIARKDATYKLFWERIR